MKKWYVCWNKLFVAVRAENAGEAYDIAFANFGGQNDYGIVTVVTRYPMEIDAVQCFGVACFQRSIALAIEKMQSSQRL